ncbi:hypothetical protein AB2M62_14570 [Sphingomonas sp. MMS12-HWE2-04]|uniref:hypothetical protein n=1 Tax=Sphingomonas sp. MMS12-HWE2-04 TaxID=3234199 RepID=UPI00384B3AEB
MSLAYLLLALQAAGGVPVTDVPQIGIATKHARCIVRQVGVAPANEAARTAKIQDAIKGCRAFTELDRTDGRVTIGGRPVNNRWWSKMQETLDAVEADVAAAIATPKQYKIIWELPDGARVDAYAAPEPLKTVRLITVPL